MKEQPIIFSAQQKGEPMKTRTELIAEIKLQREEIAQYFRDVDHWNSINPGSPIDADPDGQMKRIADAYDRTLAIEARRAQGAA